MKLLGGDLIIIRPENEGSMVTEQVKNCLDNLHVICHERNLLKLYFYKFILFLNENDNDLYSKIEKELTSLIKNVIHQEVLVICLYQAPINYDVVMEAYYYDPENWYANFYSHKAGGAVVFKKEGITISTGYMNAYDSNCRTNSWNTFSALEMLLSETGFTFRDIIRQWNYIEGILQFDGSYQHYQIFNEIRTKFYNNHFKEKGYPAATGIGIKKGGVIVEYVALLNSETKTIPLDNPRQIPAYRYHQDVLKGQPLYKVKATPKFERGLYLSISDMRFLFISGTAAISGEQVIYPGSPSLQTLHTIDNISELISKENLCKKDISAEKITHDYLRIYIKEKHDFLEIQTVCKKEYKETPCVWLQADICRDELLVEIEGIFNLI
jgi:enamine deaminase RidA (YjgF/YER057c/UK114 family)